MKKFVSTLLVCVLFVLSIPFSASAYKIGDVIGYALSTDIAATINGYDIPSFNVDGYTYVIVEDLRYYGFAVNYDNASRSLSVNRDFSQLYASKVYQKPYVSPSNIGAREHNLLYTDIVTYLDGYYTPAFNINGQTIIRFDSLAAYGAVSYDNDKREISLIISGLATNPYPVDRTKKQMLTKSDFLSMASGWWVDLNSCRSVSWSDGCLLDYMMFSSEKVEFGSTYSEFFTYELKELTFIGNNTYNALFYMPAYWYGDEYFSSEYANATIIYDGGDEMTIIFNSGLSYTYTFIGTGHDYDSIQRHPTVVNAARR